MTLGRHRKSAVTSLSREETASKMSPTEMFLHRLSGRDREPDLITMDHCYARPWNAHPDASHARPARMLFMKGFPRHHGLETSSSHLDSFVDVVTTPCRPKPPFDVNKANSVLSEREKIVNSIRAENVPEDWEEQIKRSGWTVMQNRIFNKMMKVLHSDGLAKLACQKHPNEIVMRRLSVDKMANRVRQIFASVHWDMKLLHWLHQLLMDHLNTQYLLAYLDVLQTLKTKVPTLIDKMLSQGSHLGRQATATSDALSQLLKKSWDPITSLLTQHKPKRLPNSPVLVLTPSSPNQSSTSHSRRMRFWHSQLSALGKVVPVSIHTVNGGSGVAINQCLEHIIGAVRTKVLELKSHFPNRPIILIGWTTGGLIASHVALLEKVTAVVCLGFPVTGISGSRGDLDDPLLEGKTPTLFVVGQNASMSSIDDVEDFRERMRAESGLVVVGGADDFIRVSRIKKKLDGITQTIVDRCVVGEIGDFLGGVLTQSGVGSQSFSSLTERALSRGDGHPGQVRRKRKPLKEATDFSETITKRKPRAPGSCRQAVSYTRGPPPSPRSSTTETSSTGSCGSETNFSPPEAKRSTSRKVGRPPGESTRQRKPRMPVGSVIGEAKSAPQTPASVASAVVPGSPAPTLTTGEDFAAGGDVSSYARGVSVSDPTVASRSSAGGLSLSIGSLSSLSHFHQTQALSASSTQSTTVTNFQSVTDALNTLAASSSLDALSASYSSASTSSPQWPCSVMSSTSNSHTVTSNRHSVTNPLGLVGKQTLSKVPKLASATNTATMAGATTLLAPIGSSKIASSFGNTTVGQCTSAQSKGCQSSKSQELFEPDKDQVEAIQKLQYHDFPLTTACLTRSAVGGTPVVTQAKILTSGSLDLLKLQNIIHSPSVSGKSLLTTTVPSGTSFSLAATTPSSTSPLKSHTLLLTSVNLDPSKVMTATVSNPKSPGVGRTIQLHRMIVKGPPTSTGKARHHITPLASSLFRRIAESQQLESANTPSISLDQGTAYISSDLNSEVDLKGIISGSIPVMDVLSSSGTVGLSTGIICASHRTVESAETVQYENTSSHDTGSQNLVSSSQPQPAGTTMYSLIPTTSEVHPELLGAPSSNARLEFADRTLLESDANFLQSLVDQAPSPAKMKTTDSDNSPECPVGTSESHQETPSVSTVATASHSRSRVSLPSIVSTRTRRIRAPKYYDF